MKSQTRTLEQIIFGSSTHQVKIPKYQRPYSWGLHQIEEFWDDIVQVNPTFFIGPVIVNNENFDNSSDSYIEIVDGQQRLISSTILAAVLRDTFKEYGDIRKSEKIQERFIAFEDDNGDVKGYRLTTGLTTDEFFKENIQNKNSDINNSIPQTKEHKRIKENYLLFKKQLDNYLSPETSNEKKIQKIGFIRDILKKLMVIEIEINNDNEAYEIFERVNNYGVDLSLSDLLKNHILKNSNNVDSASKKWLNIEKNIRSTDSEMKKFIRYHWLSKYSFKSEKQLYNDIKVTIRDYDEFLNELSKSSDIYCSILGNNENDFNDLKINENKIGNKIFSAVQASNYMSISQDNVFYMSLMRNIENNKLLINPKKFLLFLEKFIFKYFAICHLPANKVERLFSKYAIELEKKCNVNLNKENITKANIKQNTDRLFKEFESELRNLTKSIRENFIDKFQEIKYGSSQKNRKLITYILSKYENHLQGSSEFLINYQIINIEHILPQKPDNWGLTKNEIKDYVNNLGNLVLIDQKLNGQMGNKRLENKIPILSQSNIKMNKKIISELHNCNQEDNKRIIRQMVFDKQIGIFLASGMSKTEATLEATEATNKKLDGDNRIHDAIAKEVSKENDRQFDEKFERKFNVCIWNKEKIEKRNQEIAELSFDKIWNF